MKTKKILIYIPLLSLMLAFIPFGNSLQAMTGTIHQTMDKKNITSGVTLETIKRFTDNGWISIQVLKTDLTNKQVKIDTLTHTESIMKPDSIKSLAQARNAIAAINASFFGASSQSGLVVPIGPIVESGTLKLANTDFNQDKDVMATFAVNNANVALLDYWKTNIRLLAPNGNAVAAQRYNKPYYGYEDYSIIDRKMSASTMGIQPNGVFSDIVEMLVDKDRVVEIRTGKPATEIPKNGYVVITRKAGSAFLNNNFKVGDKVTLDITTTPDWKNLNMAVTGGAVLLKNGVMPIPFSHPSNGRHPRTAMGSSKDGKTVFMVTVDGRQQGSIGMTLEELAKLMTELGAYNALNLDGGGSTTMVARNPGARVLSLANSPSGGVQRRVSNGVGIFSLAPPAPLSGLILETEDSNIFINTSRSFTVKGYDQYYNPVEIKPEDIKWSVSGIQGAFMGNMFYPASVGEGTIKATVGKVTGTLPISALSAPVELHLDKSTLTLSVDSFSTFTLQGINKNGYTAKIEPKDAQWAVGGDLGYFIENKFYAIKEGVGYIDASVGATHAYCSITSLPVITTLLDGFETSKNTFLSYPSTVKGSYELSVDQKHQGKSSGKLSYQFDSSEESRAAYVVFPETGLSLPPDTFKIGVWVYNSQENTNHLKIEVYDGQNQKHLIEGTNFMEWIGWRYVEIPLTGIQNPTRITKLYIVQTEPVADAGAVYFDDICSIALDTTSEIGTVIPPTAITLKDGFEVSNGKFLAYPSTVKGSYQITNEQKHLEAFSGKLTYSFTNTGKSQAAYLVLPQNGIKLENTTTSIGLWVYNPEKSTHLLRAEIVHANGKKQYLTFSEALDFTGWKYVEVSLAGLPQPFRLTRLYVLNLNSAVHSGSIYFDNLSFIRALPKAIDIADIPSDTRPMDENMKAVSYKKGTSNYRFAVFGQSREPQSDLEKLLMSKLVGKTNQYLEAAALVGGSSHAIISEMKKPTLATHQGYAAMDLPSSRLIQMDMSKKSLRLTDPTQWYWLQEQLESYKGQNVFLLLSETPDSFNDTLEAKLLKDVLTKYRQTKFKNIWVFYKGNENSSRMERGIKYISSKGYEMEGATTDQVRLTEYILVTVMGNEVTFQFKPIL